LPEPSVRWPVVHVYVPDEVLDACSVEVTLASTFTVTVNVV
jgi:hypothetical protein